MNYLDLFAGIGGFAKGFQQAGLTFEKHYASEIDKYARSIYARQFPESIQLGDVTRIGNELGKIDLITGGFPCQSFSIAGQRRGFEDIRGTLFFDIARLASIYRPRYMVLENVKGLLNHDGGNTIRVILDELRRLDYYVQLLLVNTKDFNVPQNRERVFFICSLAGERRPEVFHIRERKTEVIKGTEVDQNKILGKSYGELKVRDDNTATCLDANYFKGIDNRGQRTYIGTLRTHKDGEGFREMQSGICPTIPARAIEDGSGQPIVAIPCLSPDRVEKQQNGRRFKEDGDPMFTLTAQDRHGVCIVENQRAELRKMDISPSLQASSSGRVGQSPPVVRVKSATKSGYEVAHEGDSINFSVLNSKTRRGRVGKGVAQTLDTACNQAVINLIDINKPTPTVRASGRSSLDRHNHDTFFDGFNIRRLTPIECERLQDFPDCWTKFGEKGELISDSMRYKTLGNSVTVRVVEEIAKTILEAINGK